MTGAAGESFFNEIGAYPAQWTRELMGGPVSRGVVSEEDIRDIQPASLAGFRRAHFFSGIAIWDAVLNAAGWPDGLVTWTGSCPCQPFSAAGARKGTADERHLWPHWFHLIEQCQPAIVLGEQVASTDGLEWLDLVSADLEAAGYAFGVSDLCAAGFGGAHIRQRLYFVGVADAESFWRREQSGCVPRTSAPQSQGDDAWPHCPTGGVADTDMFGRAPRSRNAGICRANNGPRAAAEQFGASCAPVGVADTDNPRLEGRAGMPERADQRAVGPSGLAGSERPRAPLLGRQPADWLFCRDAKWRPVEAGTFPLDSTDSRRVGRSRTGMLKGYGNALDYETALNFVEAVRGVIFGGYAA